MFSLCSGWRESQGALTLAVSQLNPLDYPGGLFAAFFSDCVTEAFLA